MKKIIVGLVVISVLIIGTGAAQAASMGMYASIGDLTGIGFNFTPTLAMEIGTTGLTFANGANNFTVGAQLKYTMGGSAKSASWQVGGGVGLQSQSANNQSQTTVGVWGLIGFKAFITPNFAVVGDVKPIALLFPPGSTTISVGTSSISVNVYF